MILKEIAVIADCKDYSVELNPSKEGGWVDVITIAGNIATFIQIISPFILHLFSKVSEKNISAKTLIEAATALKNGNFTEEEALILVKGNSQLEKFVSEYYKHLSKEIPVVSVEGQLINLENKKVICKSSINREDFNSHIIAPTKDTQEIVGTDIQIISPLLIDVGKGKWKGKYNGEEISFDVKDNEFLTQVHNREVVFESGTSIKCDIHIDQKITEKGALNKVKNTYTVTNVYSWEDGQHMKIDAKKYKKINK